MHYKYILMAVVVAGVVVMGGYFLLNPSTTTVPTDVTDVTDETVWVATSSVVNPVEAVPDDVASDPNPTVPPPVTSVATQTTVVTLTDVQAHRSEASCWTAISGKVYDVTAFISKHPGGDRNILRICGIDGTRLFTGQHGGQTKPEQTLAEFYLGDLQ